MIIPSKTSGNEKLSNQEYYDKLVIFDHFYKSIKSKICIQQNW